MADPKIIDLSTFDPTVGFIVQGDVAYDYAGIAVSSAGDVNGDGFADFMLGADRADDGGINNGEVYVIFGKAGLFGSEVSGRQVLDLSLLDAASGFVILGDSDNDRLGLSVSSAGDINGDGLDDVIVGARSGNDGGPSAGEAYVIFGSAGGFGSIDGSGRQVIDLTSLDATTGFIVQGDTDGDRAGYSVSSAGDVNGDGLDDIIVGAFVGDDGGNYAGEAYVIFGTTAGFGTDVGGSQGYRSDDHRRGDRLYSAGRRGRSHRR